MIVYSRRHFFERKVPEGELQVDRDTQTTCLEQPAARKKPGFRLDGPMLSLPIPRNLPGCRTCGKPGRTFCFETRASIGFAGPIKRFLFLVVASSSEGIFFITSFGPPLELIFFTPSSSLSTASSSPYSRLAVGWLIFWSDRWHKRRIGLCAHEQRWSSPLSEYFMSPRTVLPVSCTSCAARSSWRLADDSPALGRPSVDAKV